MAKAPKITTPVSVTANDRTFVYQMKTGYYPENPYWPALIVVAKSGACHTMLSDIFKAQTPAKQVAFLRAFIGDLEEIVIAMTEPPEDPIT